MRVMEHSVYLFCLMYHHNHFVMKDKDISKYIDKYREVLYGGNQMDAKSFKQVYNQYKDEALKTLEGNISYCEEKKREGEMKNSPSNTRKKKKI